MIGRRLTALLLCVTLCWTQDTDWDWLCGNVTAPDGVNISQILGRWYVAAANIPNVDTDDVCIAAEFSSQNQNDSTLLFKLYLGESGGYTYLSNNTIDVITPSKWHNGRNPIVVVHLQPEGNTLALVACRITNATAVHVTVVFSKSRTPELAPLYSQLEAAGLPNWSDKKVFNLQTCPTGFL